MSTAGRRVLVILCSFLLWAAPPVEGLQRQKAERAAAEDPRWDRLPRRHREWIELTRLLTSEAELDTFLSLSRDYQRDAFIDRFWQSRDPYPETTRNEFRESWEERAQLATDLYAGLDDDRARMLLYNGEPETKDLVNCFDLVRPLEIWYYSRTDRIRDSFALVFYSRGGGVRNADRLWYPSQGFSPLLQPRAGVLGTEELLAQVREECPRGDTILSGLLSAADWGRIERSIDIVPSPGDEWLKTFVSYSTDLPLDAVLFEADVSIEFPGGYQSRTAVQGAITVEPSPEGGGTFLLDGEVLRKGELFEHFRYRFPPGGAPVVDGRIPLIFQRYLRPGSYWLVLKLEDVAGNRFFRREMPLDVPSPRTLEEAQALRLVSEGAEDAAEPSIGSRLREANASLGEGDASVRLLPPPDRLVTGRARFEALVTGSEVARVRFLLDGKSVLSKNRPPFSVELNLGEVPRTHTLRAVAVDADGEVIASDEVLVNAGPHRFAVRLVEPRPGENYVESLRATVAVEVPEGEVLERVELFLNETRITSLYQPPFSHPIFLPEGSDVQYVRAVAYLTDGNSTEDAVFINAPDYSEDLKVRFVELYTTVVDRRNRPVEGLDRSAFRVLEDGVEKRIERFETVEDQPIYAGILLDTSSSMAEELKDAVKGALEFFDTVLTPKDRAAVITFNTAPDLAVRFTNDPEVLAGGLAGLVSEGETALYDSLVYALYYFSGIRGQRALVVLSDGEDVGSRYSYEDVIEYARQTGVTIYAVGINLSTRQADIRLKLHRLAAETGGQPFFVDRASGLTRVYEAIENELRSQYLLAYQISTEGTDDRFREIKVEVDLPGHEAKTVRGYYP